MNLKAPAAATRCLFALLLLIMAIVQPLQAAPAASLHVAGAVAKPVDWTNAQLSAGQAGPVQTVRYTLKGSTHTAHCVALLSVVEAAQPNFNARIKNHRLQFIIAVQGFDGYTADFSLAELLPEFGNHPVWLALDEDGKPLTDESSPVSLIVPDDVNRAAGSTESLLSPLSMKQRAPAVDLFSLPSAQNPSSPPIKI